MKGNRCKRRYTRGMGEKNGKFQFSNGVSLIHFPLEVYQQFSCTVTNIHVHVGVRKHIEKIAVVFWLLTRHDWTNLFKDFSKIFAINCDRVLEKNLIKKIVQNCKSLRFTLRPITKWSIWCISYVLLIMSLLVFFSIYPWGWRELWNEIFFVITFPQKKYSGWSLSISAMTASLSVSGLPGWLLPSLWVFSW